MAISSYFQDAIDLVDSAKVLSFTVDASYEALEWSYSGLDVVGGSDAACAIGAAALLDAMGFRFYAPMTKFWKLPSSIPTGLFRARGASWIPSASTFLVYGHSWGGSNAASRALLNDAYQQWATLCGVNLSSYPAGHRWWNVISNSEEFFENNPDLIKPHGGQSTFDLPALHGTSRWDYLAEYCAAFLLSAGLNEFNRTNFDPVDGDNNPSDLVYPFSLEVVTRMRAGTSAIGGIPEQAGVPDAQIGLYAYAGHRLPPSQPYKPGVYVQVALAFNSTGMTYQELFDAHGPLSDGIAIREYLDTQTWSDGKPMGNARNRVGYLDRYDAFQAAGALAVHSEFTANWLVNMVMARSHVVKFRTGVENTPAIIDEMVSDIFGGDEAVKELYTYWTRPTASYNKWALRQSFDIVDGMENSWYKTFFKQLLTIYYQFHRCENAATYGIVRNPGQPDDTFGTEISKLLSWVTAVRDDDIIHSYAFLRQEANAALSDYPHLKLNAAPEPAWFASSYAPTESDWLSALGAIRAETVRDPALDGDDLVLRSVTPVSSRDQTPATKYRSIEGVTMYAVVGPSRVKLTDVPSEEISYIEYGPGFHYTDFSPNHLIEWEGGMVFMNTFPEVRKDPDGTDLNHWLFVPSSVAGDVKLLPEVRWAFYDEEVTRKDWNPTTTFPDLGPGQCAVDNVNTRGTISNENCNRFISPLATIALMPRELAVRSGPVSTIRFVPEPN